MLVGGGELHDRWSSLVRCNRPLGRGIQRFTGITQEMLADAPGLEEVLPPLQRLLRKPGARGPQRPVRPPGAAAGVRADRPRVAQPAGAVHRGAGAQAAAAAAPARRWACWPTRSASRSTPRTGRWPTPRRARASCARCSRGCARTRSTIADAMAIAGRAGAGARPLGSAQNRRRRPPPPQLDFADLPKDPGVYLFRNEEGRVLYVGKSISIRSRARAHFAPVERAGRLDRAGDAWSTTRARTPSSGRWCSRTA